MGLWGCGSPEVHAADFTGYKSGYKRTPYTTLQPDCVHLYSLDNETGGLSMFFL